MSLPLLRVDHVSKRFDNGVLAVDDVTFDVFPGETVGIVGESGCGKSTTGKIILRLLAQDRGEVVFDGLNLSRIASVKLRNVRKELQLVPQNPQTSLNPRLTVEKSIAFNLRAHSWPRRDLNRRIDDLLDRVGIPNTYKKRYPHELSGGQLQRVAIARALSTDPKLIICDEAVSALDKSIQAQILNLFADLQKERNMAYVFISHDLSVVEHLSDRVLVMYLGRIVEQATTEELWSKPTHPYTTALLASVPGKDAQRIVLEGDLPSPVNPPSGCGFRTRCPMATEICAEERPAMVRLTRDHAAACVFADPDNSTPVSLMRSASE